MSLFTGKQRRLFAIVAIPVVLLLAFLGRRLLHRESPTPYAWLRWDPAMDDPSELTTWPWPGTKQSTPHRGLTHWTARAKDGTTVDLVCFDFAANPALRLELYAQDEDDARPFDNVVRFWPMGVGQATRHLNAKLKATDGGQVVAAWNGPFFGYHRVAAIPDETAFHLAPVVLRGKVFHNTSNHRWTFGVQYLRGKPVFKTFHLAGRPILEKEFDFASGTLQCLVKDGKPLKLEPFPRSATDFRKRPVPSTPEEVGHIPHFDHAKFSRVSMGWSKDNRQFFLLVVKELDSESQSIDALTRGIAQPGGWMVSDLQRFWLSMLKQGKIWNAVNNDAGDVAQLTLKQPDNKYLLLTPRGDRPKFDRKLLAADFEGAPQGGALMYFYVRDVRASRRLHRYNVLRM